MSELCVRCPECGQEYKIPPHVTVMGLKCLECGVPMSAAARTASAEAGALEIAAPACPVPAGEVASVEAGLAPALNSERSPFSLASLTERDLSSFVSGALFLLIGGLMVGFQYFAPSLEPYAHEYIIFRNLLTLSAVVLVAYSAAKDGIFRGIFCVLFPPYLLLYATSQEESPWLRGIFMGVLLGLCAEAFLLPQESLVLGIGPAINDLIAQVESWMALASRPPV